MTFIIVILLFPLNPGPTPATMNYTVVVVGGIFTTSTIYYFFPVYGGRHWFSGPVRNIDNGNIKDVEEKKSLEKDT
jgi:hypothetical protein